MYQVLYREYRPETFDEVIGQDNIVRILSNQIASERVGHAYLFCGTRGTGKTTTARLLAKGVNCLSNEEKPCGKCKNCLDIAAGRFVDVIEVDAASNNGIEDVKAIRESVLYPPAIGRKKVYIIDEVHMMSKPGFNALLKTLEEPPDNIIFILATTDPDRLPQTILSRCIRMDFKRVANQKIIEQIRQICEDRGIDIDDSALSLLAMNADGSVRDALTLLEQTTTGRSGLVDRKSVLEALGSVGDETYVEIISAIEGGKVEDIFIILDRLFSAGKDARQVLSGLINYYRNLMFIKYVPRPEDHLNLSKEIIELMKPQAAEISLEKIRSAVIDLSKVSYDANLSTQPRTLLELALVRLAALEAEKNPFMQDRFDVDPRTATEGVDPDQLARQSIRLDKEADLPLYKEKNKEDDLLDREGADSKHPEGDQEAAGKSEAKAKINQPDQEKEESPASEDEEGEILDSIFGKYS